MSPKPLQLSLRDLHRLMRPAPFDQLVPVDAWRETFEEIAAVISDQASGLVLIHGAPGSGKSTFQRQLANFLSASGTCQVLRGLVGEPVDSSGWFINFLGEAVVGTQSPRLSPRDIMVRLNDLSSDAGGLTVILDGLDAITDRVLLSDFKSFLNLVRASNIRVLIVATVTDATAEMLTKASNLSSDYGVVARPLATLTDDEKDLVIERRLIQAGLRKADIQSILEKAIVQEKEFVGERIRVICEYLGGHDAAGHRLPDVDVATKPKRPKRTAVSTKDESLNAHSERRSFDEFLKPKKSS